LSGQRNPGTAAPPAALLPGFRFLFSLHQRFLAAIKDLVGVTDCLHLIFIETTTLQAHGVTPNGVAWLPWRDDKRRHVLGNTGTTAHHHVGADDAELVDSRHAANNGMVVNFHMPGKRSIVRQDTGITHHTVVRNVYVNHQQVVITYLGQPCALRCAAMNGHAFANAIAIANLDTRRFARVFQILIHFTNRGKLIDLVVATDFGQAIHHNVGLQYRAFADFHLGADVTEGTDVRTSADNGTFFNKSR
jgi:hypothetical protein